MGIVTRNLCLKKTVVIIPVAVEKRAHWWEFDLG